jgi:hypothetical protein
MLRRQRVIVLATPMTRTHCRLALAVSVLLAAVVPRAAQGALLTLDGSSLTFKVGSLQVLTFFQDSPVLVPVSSGDGGFTEPAGIFTGTEMLPTSLCPGVCLTSGFTIAQLSNSAKTIGPGAAGSGHTVGIVRPGGGMGGPGPLQGDAIINVLGLFNLVVPLEVVGSTGADAMVVAGTLMVSAFGTGWTTGPVTITGVTTQVSLTTFGGGEVVNTVTFGALGYDNRTPLHNGVIALVSPFKVVTNAAGNLPAFALQTLVFSGGVPEPGTLVLLGTAFAALALRGWVAQVRSRRR